MRLSEEQARQLHKETEEVAFYRTKLRVYLGIWAITRDRPNPSCWPSKIRDLVKTPIGLQDKAASKSIINAAR